MNDITWQLTNGLILTAVGLAISALLWRRRGPASGIKGVAWSLLPLAAALTGTLSLLWSIGDSIVNWAVRLVFSPVVWLGIMVAGVSVVLFGVSSVMNKRGVGTRGRRPKQVGSKEETKHALPRQSGPAAESDGDDDLADIESILKKHGIS